MQHWGKMMNDELAAIAGKYEQLVGQLQEGYGKVVEETRMHAARCRDAEEQLKKSERKLMELKKSMISNEKSGRGGKRNSGRTYRGR